MECDKRSLLKPAPPEYLPGTSNPERIPEPSMGDLTVDRERSRTFSDQSMGEMAQEENLEALKIDVAIKKFQNILQLNPNTFTKKQEAIFSLALKEALYEILEVPHRHRDLENEMLRIKRHEFWK